MRRASWPRRSSTLDSVDAVHVDPDGALVVLSRNVLDLQIELPRLAQAAAISLRRVEPLDDSLESVFGYLVEQLAMGSVYRLTLRQLSGRWRLAIMTVLAAMPVIIAAADAALRRSAPSVARVRERRS